MTIETWDNIIKYGAYSQELPWFALDNQENIGVFVATMNAPIPDDIKNSFQKYIYIKHAIDLLPKMTSALLVTSNKGDFSDWIFYAEKGLFAYDFQDNHRVDKKKYELIAKPILPINLSSIVDSSIKSLVELLRLDCDFSEGDVSDKFII